MSVPTNGNGFDDKKTDLLKTTICKGSNNEEFQLFLHACKRTGLDPFMRQIYAVKRWNGNTKREEMTIQTGIDGFRLIAERTGRYAPGKESTFMYDKDGNLLSATAYVKKQTADGTWHEVSSTSFWEEYVQKTKEGKPTKFWANMPHIMLAKTAEAQALRRAFPAELSGVYAEEEMAQAENVSPEQLETELKYEKAQADKDTLISPVQVEELRLMFDDAELTEEELNKFFEWRKIGNLEQILVRDFEVCKKAILKIKENHEKERSNGEPRLF